MSGDTVITINGNLTAAPELRYTPAGVAVANFTVASTSRFFDRQANEWRDGDALFLRCNLWREAAENAAESLERGARVIVTGRLKQRSYETREGEKRTVVELEVDEVGPSLRNATAKVARTGRTGSSGGGFAQPDTTTRTNRANNTPATETQNLTPRTGDADEPAGGRAPWETPVLAGAGAGFGEPPF
ncbi:single-stranded DNA-binding protein [Nocardia rhizosphaerihabitans]|uniref:single-stranded DNA-binding protein n=1 Tax=Nocardia rhizosphaerihabitans TaxID=1691570 RepID=UPI00366CC037